MHRNYTARSLACRSCFLLVCLAGAFAFAQTPRSHGWGPPPGKTVVPPMPAAPGTPSGPTLPVEVIGSWWTSLKNSDDFPFLALFTFHADGTFVGATQGDVCCGGNSTAQHGAWTPKGHKVAMAFYHLDYDPDTGELLDYARIEFDIQLSGPDAWSGTWKAWDYDPDGHLIGTDNGTAQGARILPRQ